MSSEKAQSSKQFLYKFQIYRPFCVSTMIKLTRFGGEVFILNADMIRYVEARPDTFITMTTGERLVVTESMDEVLRRSVVYQQAKHLVPAPAGPRRQPRSEMRQDK